MKYEISEMGIGGILDQAVALFRNHFWLLIKIALCMYIPINLVFSFITLAIMPDMTSEMAQQRGAAMGEAAIPLMVVTVIYVLLFSFIVNPLTQAAIIRAISREYLGNPTTTGESFKFAFKRLGALIITSIYAGLLIFLGLMLCIIPGIYLAFRYWLATYSVVIEETSGGAALKRSGVLMKGNMGKAFVLGLIVGVIAMLVNMVGSIIPSREIASVVQVLLQSVILAFGAGAGVVFYFSSRCGNEHFDLTLLADAMGEEPPEITPEHLA